MSNRITVKSSNIASLDWDSDPTAGFEDGPELGPLTVSFTNGRTYVYEDVSKDIYDELVAEALSTREGASVGKTFNKLVRQGGFAFSEVE